jgi:hypothetical protein
VVSGQEPAGVVLDLAPDPVPASSGGVWGSMREISLPVLLRLVPGVLRQVFAGREPVGGLPVVEPGRSRPAGLPEVDFGESFPVADHAPAAAGAVAAARTVAAEAVAEALAAQDGAPAGPAATVVMTGEQLREEWLAAHDAGTELQDVIEDHAEQEAEQRYEAWLAAEQADFDAGAGPYEPDPGYLAQVDAVFGDGPSTQAQAAAVEAGAELGEAGLEAGL